MPAQEILVNEIGNYNPERNSDTIIHESSCGQFYNTINGNSQMTSIKQSVNISTHCETVGYSIFTIILERFDVCGFQNFWHGDIGNHTTLASPKYLFSECCLVRTGSVEGTHTLSFHLRSNLCASYCNKCLGKRLVFRFCFDQFLDFFQNQNIQMILLLQSAVQEGAIHIAIVV